MNNWEGGEGAKHWLDRETGERPRIRVAYLDVQPREEATVNGLAIPVNRQRLAALDRRELNYNRIEVTEALETAIGGRVFAYIGTAAARERCRRARADGDGFISREYLGAARAAFAALGDDALAEFDRTTDPLPFPLADLRVVNPPSSILKPLGGY